MRIGCSRVTGEVRVCGCEEECGYKDVDEVVGVEVRMAKGSAVGM